MNDQDESKSTLEATGKVVIGAGLGFTLGIGTLATGFIMMVAGGLMSLIPFVNVVGIPIGLVGCLVTMASVMVMLFGAIAGGAAGGIHAGIHGNPIPWRLLINLIAVGVIVYLILK